MPVKRVANLSHGDVIMWPESPCGVAEVVGHMGTAPELRWPGAPGGVLVWDPGGGHVVMVVGNIRAVEHLASQQQARQRRTKRQDTSHTP